MSIIDGIKNDKYTFVLFHSIGQRCSLEAYLYNYLKTIIGSLTDYRCLNADTYCIWNEFLAIICQLFSPLGEAIVKVQGTCLEHK